MAALGTDILRDVFGEIRTDILSQSEGGRTVRHVSGEKVVGYAFVEFMEGVSAFPEIHSEIQSGLLIGETFRKRGIAYSRDEVCVMEYRIPENLRRIFGTEQELCFVKQAEIFVGDGRAHYGSVVEVYSPPVRFDNVHDRLGCSERVKGFLDGKFS